MRLSKMTGEGKIGTVIPDHDELKPGTLKGLLNWQKLILMIFTVLSDIFIFFSFPHKNCPFPVPAIQHR